MLAHRLQLLAYKIQKITGTTIKLSKEPTTLAEDPGFRLSKMTIIRTLHFDTHVYVPDKHWMTNHLQPGPSPMKQTFRLLPNGVDNVDSAP